MTRVQGAGLTALAGAPRDRGGGCGEEDEARGSGQGAAGLKAAGLLLVKLLLWGWGRPLAPHRGAAQTRGCVLG